MKSFLLGAEREGSFNIPFKVERGGGGIVLPDGAVALDYVVSGSRLTRALDTRIIPSVGTDIYCLAEPSPTTVIVIFGAGGQWIGHQSSFVVTSSNGGTGMSVTTGQMTEYAVVGGRICVNGVQSAVTTQIIGKTSSLAYGAFAPSSASYKWLGKLGRMWAVREGERIIDLIPCLHNGLTGFCDLVTKEFFAEGQYEDYAN